MMLTDAAWRFLNEPRTYTIVVYPAWGAAHGQREQRTHTLAAYPGIAYVTLAIARFNEMTGRWATARDLAGLTGASRSWIDSQLRKIREYEPQPGLPHVQHSRVGNRTKYQINPGQ